MMRRKRYRTQACEAGVCPFYPLDQIFGYVRSYAHPRIQKSVSGRKDPTNLPRHGISLSGRHRVIQSHTLRFR